MSSQVVDLKPFIATTRTANTGETGTSFGISEALGPTLRQYQHSILDEVLKLEGGDRCCIWLPTGGGKTEVACAIAQRAKGKVLFIVERIVLAKQTENRFIKYRLVPDYIQGSDTIFRGASNIIVASIQSLTSKGKKDKNLIPWDELEYVIVDEAHIIYKEHVKILDRIPKKTKVIGLSATPIRPGMKELYHNLIKGPSYLDMIRSGYLVKPVYYAVCEETLEQIKRVSVSSTGDYAQNELSKAMVKLASGIVEKWRKYGGDKRQTIAFAVDIPHAKRLADEFLKEGVSVEHIDCHTKDEDRERILENFRTKKTQVLTNVGVLSLGFDEPVASCAILARPTLSTILHIQQVGRVLRPHEEKSDAIVIDHAGNCLVHGLIEEFSPSEELPEKLETGSHLKKPKDKPQAKTCKACNAINAYSAILCINCGQPFIKSGKKIVEVDAKFKKIEYQSKGEQKKIEIEELVTYEEIRSYYLQALFVAKELGYKPGWAYYKTLNKFGESTKIPKTWGTLDPILPSDYGLRYIMRNFRKRR